MTTKTTYTSEHKLFIQVLNPLVHSISGHTSENYKSILISKYASSHLNCKPDSYLVNSQPKINCNINIAEYLLN